MNALLLALVLFSGGASPEPGVSFPKPTIHRIRVAGDTVRFEGDRGYDTVKVRYCYVRRSATWCPLPRLHTASARPARRVPRTTSDTVPLTTGLSLVCRAPDEESGCGTFGVLTADDRRVHWLAPQLTPPRLAILREAYDIETDEPLSISSSITEWAVADDAVWFGVAGGFPEGQGAFGALMRFDRRRRAVETVVRPDLAAATVTSLAVDGGALWVGTLHPLEYGAVGSTGIIRQDLGTGVWTTLDSAGAHLPDKLIRTLLARGGSLYAATADGLAIFDAHRATWTIRYFRRAIIGDSIVHALTVARPSDEARDEALYVVMQALEVRRRGAFAATARARGLKRLAPVIGQQAPVDSILAHGSFVPFLVEALTTPRGSAVAAGALARIGDRRAVPHLRAALARPAPSYETAPLAVALARLGDSTGVTILHERLTSSGGSHDRDGVLAALTTLKDPRSVPVMLAFMTRPPVSRDARYAAVGALREYGSADVWRRLVDTAAARPELREVLVDLADPVALSDARVRAALGPWALDLLGERHRDHDRSAAVRLAARLRPHDAVPALVRFLSDRAQGGAAAVELVRLTGVDSAPPVMPWSEPGRGLAQQFWDAWLAANRGGYETVRPDAGEKAYRRWLENVLQRERLERERRRGGQRRG